MSLYHFEIGFPPLALAQVKPLFTLRPTAHAENEAWDDKRGVIRLPKIFHPAVAKIIELETDVAGRVVKILAREKHDDKTDVVYAVAVADKAIKTAWLQDKTDLHRTLDRSKYNRP